MARLLITKDMKEIKFSLSMSVYKNDNPTFFKLAVESATIKQTLRPSELILVVDGPVPVSIDSVISELQKELPMPLKCVRFKENQGHAGARQAGLEHATNNIVAIMDSDDIALPDRFEKQLQFLDGNPDIDIVGGQIAEFIDNEDNIVGERIVPLEDTEIKEYLKARCPMNLVTIMARKDAIQRVGGYMDWYCEEDYYLWIRMALAGCKFANLPDTLVNVRVGKEMYSRRGGWKYFKSEAKLQGYMLTHKVISFPRYVYNVSIRFVVQALLPNKIRGWVFRTFARK